MLMKETVKIAETVEIRWKTALWLASCGSFTAKKK